MLSRLIALLFLLSLLVIPLAQGQNIDFSKPSTLGNLFIRMYGEVHYYQPITADQFDQGQFDAKRIVALFGYQFDRKTQFVTEWELEHADEIYLEQAFIKHKISGKTFVKAGMILIPMGIVNENHEPNNYYSVDRPMIDRVMVPSTWRDIGIGVNGLLTGLDVRYQLYLVNGLLGYADGSAKFKSSNNFRSGRQKGSKTIFSGAPAISGRLEYFGFSGSKIGLSVYSGVSNSDAFKGLSKTDELAISSADSTTVYTNMLGLHASFSPGEWNVRSQLIYSHNSRVEAYNAKTGSDLGASSLGMYVEAGRTFTKNKKWIAFARYSYYDNVLETALNQDINIGLNHIFTTGVNYMAAPGAVFKLDGQWSHLHEDPIFQINAGIGVWF